MHHLLHHLRCIFLLALLTFPALFASTLPSRAWVSCGNEGDDCTMSSAGHNLVRYGANDSFFMVETQGINRIGCNNSTFGDPAYGDGKHCEYMAAEPEAETYTRCASEGQDCNTQDVPRRIRYGAGGKWFYRIGSGKIPCNNDRFPDVAYGMGKSCEVSTRPFKLGQGAGEFRDCGTEGTDCPAGDGSDPVLIRYGVGAEWIYSLGTTGKVKCSNDTFGDPAHGQTKFCQVVKLPPQLTSVVGQWAKVGDCQNCSTLQRQVQVGLSGSRAKTVTNSWTNEVSVTLETSVTFEKIGGEKQSVTAKTSTTEAKAITDTLTRQQAETMTATCSSQPTEKLEMFQWKVDVDELCYVNNGQCRSTISQFRILCVHDQPNGFKPICPPSMCVDANCTKCQQ